MGLLAIFAVSCLLLTTSIVEGRGEYRLGGSDGNTWQTGLSEAGAGEYVVIDESGAQVQEVSVRATTFGAGGDTLLDFSGTSIQARYIDPSVNIALADINAGKTKIPLPYVPGSRVLSTDRCISWGNHQEILKKMLDGDPTTAHFREVTSCSGVVSSTSWACGRFWDAATLMDFGAELPINRVRFYPRLGTEDDVQLIESLEEPIVDLGRFGEDSFADNFVEWFELRVGEDEFPFGNDACNPRSRTSVRWVQHSDPALDVVESTRENLDQVVDIRFPTRSIRWLTFRVFPLRDWEVAEFEVYGDGFVRETAYLTQILDFGRPVTWGKVRWSGDVPAGTRVEIRSRTGHTPDPQLYVRENINGDMEEISQADYERIEFVAQLPPVYDAKNWSFWSSPYEFAEGLRDSSRGIDDWQDGTAVLSPGPSRYLQLHIRLFAAFDATPRLDQLSLQFGELPSAQQLVGEVWPVEVQSFEPVTFTYVVRPVFRSNNIGFDRLEILTHAEVSRIHSVRRDGELVPLDQFVPEVQSDRLVVGFPILRGEDDSFKHIEVVFDAPVLRFGTEFNGWVFSTADPDGIRQGVGPGNATYRLSGDALAVRTPVGGALLRDVVVKPNPFTPNGDDVNDILTWSYKLREVATDRPVHLRIFNLAGQQVIQLEPLLSQSGLFQQHWDGRDKTGTFVLPGLYAYELTLEAEAQEVQTGVFSVAY